MSNQQPITSREAASSITGWQAEVERAVHGKSEVVRRAILCLVARGHVLLDDVPGVGKTTLAQALARTIDGDARVSHYFIVTVTVAHRLWVYVESFASALSRRRQPSRAETRRPHTRARIVVVDAYHGGRRGKGA